MFFLFLGIGLSIILILSFSREVDPNDSFKSADLRFSGSEFLSRIGTAKIVGSSTAIQAISGNDQIVLSRPVNLQAEDFAYATYDIKGKVPSVFIYFLWRAEHEPEKVFRKRLYWGPRSVGTTRLRSSPHWRGQITEIGFDIYGNQRGEPLVISNLSLSSDKFINLFKSTRTDWLSFHGWSQHSINHLRAVQSKDTTSPIFFAALACVITLASAYFWSRFIFPIWPGIYLLVVFLFWLVNDALWQLQLSVQSDETALSYSDARMPSHIAIDPDPQLYAYAARLRENVLPSEASRIFIIHKETGHVFDRLRLQFHLLPHNIFNYGVFPPSNSSRTKDFVLMLGDVPNVRFQMTSGEVGELSYGETTLLVQVVDQSSIAKLYRIVDS